MPNESSIFGIPSFEIWKSKFNLAFPKKYPSLRRCAKYKPGQSLGENGQSSSQVPRRNKN